MSDIGQAANTQSSSYLSPEAIEAAFTFLTDNYPLSKWTPAQRDAWTDTLCKLYPGELRTALAVSAKSSTDSRFRPDAYPVLQIVLDLREAKARELQWEADAKAAEERKAQRADPPGNAFHAYLQTKHDLGYDVRPEWMELIRTEAS